jgi:hypothetical protein
LRIWNGERCPGLFFLAGFFAALTACTELPATAFAAALIAVLLLRVPGRTLLIALPAAALPVGAFFLTNYLALGQWQLAYSEFGGPWYEYPGSHWSPGAAQRGIDWAFMKETWSAYAFHFFIGHHGIFSLTPLWLLTAAGLSSRVGSAARPPWDERRMLAALTLGVSVVVIVFYLLRERWNYGGGTVGPRWLLWLTPLWLLTLLPAVDWLGQRRWGRCVALVCLAVSALSAAYALWNPWRHPWIYNFLDAQGRIPY